MLFFHNIYSQDATRRTLQENEDLKKMLPTQEITNQDDKAKVLDSLRQAFTQKPADERVKSPSGIDSLVTFFAKDTAIFRLSSKTMRLVGKSKIDFKVQQLNAEIIEIDFENSILRAKWGLDSNNRRYGFPRFSDAGEIFFGEEITYNFKTKRGKIVAGETKEF
ncbi:MAG TPA: hypothetical protein PK007_09395 [Candidatus Kapabacteria bacterium]|nr:hypothetical protein [Candidatus Kapabacteria bacterium]